MYVKTIFSLLSISYGICSFITPIMLLQSSEDLQIMFTLYLQLITFILPRVIRNLCNVDYRMGNQLAGQVEEEGT